MQETTNYNLPLYEANDSANLLDGYNQAMDLIDSGLKTVDDTTKTYQTQINQAKSDAASALSKANSVEGTAAAANTNAAEAKTLANTAISTANGASATATQANTLATQANAKATTNTTAIAGMASANRTGKMVIFADSTFATNQANGVTHKSIVSFLQEMMPNMTIVDKTEGGTSTARLVELLQAAASDGDVTEVIIAYGTNDWQGNYAVAPLLTTQTDSDITALNVYKALSSAKSKYPYATITWICPAYIHSTALQALNLNNVGCTPQAYWDFIQTICQEKNVNCLRLDKYFGIDENTYTRNLIPSTSTIYVHYSEKLNNKIANMIASGLYSYWIAPDVNYNAQALILNQQFNAPVTNQTQNYYNNYCGTSANGNTNIKIYTPFQQEYIIAFANYNTIKMSVDGTVRCTSNLSGYVYYETGQWSSGLHTISFPDSNATIYDLVIMPKGAVYKRGANSAPHSVQIASGLNFRSINQNVFLVEGTASLVNLNPINVNTVLPRANGIFTGYVYTGGTMKPLSGRLDEGGSLYIACDTTFSSAPIKGTLTVY